MKCPNCGCQIVDSKEEDMEMEGMESMPFMEDDESEITKAALDDILGLSKEARIKKPSKMVSVEIMSVDKKKKKK